MTSTRYMLLVIILSLMFSTTAAAESAIALKATEDGLNLSELHLDFSGEWWELSLGKQRLQWGPGRIGDLFLSDEGSFWGIFGETQWEIWSRPLRVSQLIAWIDPEINKTFFAHRLEYQVTPKLQLGLAESCVASGDFTPWLYNPIPIWPFYLTQHVLLKDGLDVNGLMNMNLALDATYVPSPGQEWYAQLFVDDAQQDLDRRGTVPDWYGILVGYHREELPWWPKASATVEYTLTTTGPTRTATQTMTIPGQMAPLLATGSDLMPTVWRSSLSSGLLAGPLLSGSFGQSAMGKEPSASRGCRSMRRTTCFSQGRWKNDMLPGWKQDTP